MASRYVKIPVVQPIYNESGGSYSKVLKTLRVPQEYLSLNTGSLYFSGPVFSDALSPELQASLQSEVEAMFNNSEETFYGAPPAIARTQYGLWMQIPLNISKVLWLDPTSVNEKGQPISTDEKYPDFNGSLWLLISQEVSFPQGGGTGKGNGLPQVKYIYPFASNLFKQNNSKYAIAGSGVGRLAVGDKDVFGVQKYLQDKLEQCFVSNPGATETLLDFGSVPAQQAGIYNNSTPSSPTPTIGSINLPTAEMEPYWNGKCRLIVTCAVVTNQGMGVNATELKDSLQSYPALGEVWGLQNDWYNSTLIGQDINTAVNVGQELTLNPAQLFTAGVQNFEMFVGDKNAPTIQANCCEEWGNGPIKGKGPGAPLPEGFEEAIMGGAMS